MITLFLRFLMKASIDSMADSSPLKCNLKLQICHTWRICGRVPCKLLATNKQFTFFSVLDSREFTDAVCFLKCLEVVHKFIHQDNLNDLGVDFG